MISNRQQGSGLLALALGVAGTFYACASSQATVLTFGTPGTVPMSAFTGEAEAGFTILPEAGNFFYSGPAPTNDSALANSIYDGPSGTPSEAAISISDGGAAFDFTSADFASRGGNATYFIFGFSGGTLAYQEIGTLTASNVFVTEAATVADSTTPITTLDISVDPMGASAINIGNIVVNAVPEPMTTSLLGLGGVALAAFGWRRRLA